MDATEMEFESLQEPTPRKRGRKPKRKSSQKPTPRKRGRKPKREIEPEIQIKLKSQIKATATASAPPPRTRSMIAPDWTTRESLILVNEISVVEGDCLKALSSYQKWKIIVDHCAALGVHRTLNQCRSKWNSLISDYDRIKQWESKSNSVSFWVLDCEKRKEFQLPENFDTDLFQAIDNYVRAQQDHADTDTDTDADADTDTDAEHEPHLLDVIAKLGSKRQKKSSISQKFKPEDKPQNICELEWSQELQAEVGPQKCCQEVNPQMCYGSETPLVQYGDQEPHGSHLDENDKVNLRMFSESETPQVQYGKQDARESYMEGNEELNPQICFESETRVKYGTQEPLEGHLEEKEEVNPQMCFESGTPQVQYGEKEHRETHLKEHEELNRQICFESETPWVKHGEQETQKSLPENNELNPQICFEIEIPQVQYRVQEPWKKHLEENEEVNHRMCFERETSHVQCSKQEPQECHLEENPRQELCRKENSHNINAEVEPQRSPKEKTKNIIRQRKKKIVGEKEEEQMAVQNLRQNINTILAVVQGNLPEKAEYGVTNTKSAQEIQTDFVRRQGDSLIACLGNIVSILDKFPFLVRESSSL